MLYLDLVVRLYDIGVIKYFKGNDGAGRCQQQVKTLSCWLDRVAVILPRYGGWD
ncbi:hypothetical protein D3C73_1468650 [compost metagenome]